MTFNEFFASRNFTMAEKYIVSYIHGMSEHGEMALSLRNSTELLGICYVTAQQSFKNLVDEKVIVCSRIRDNSPSVYRIVLDQIVKDDDSYQEIYEDHNTEHYT